MGVCDCDLCKEIRAYKKAVEENDKEYLLRHFDHYLDIGMDLDWQKTKLEELKNK